MSVSGSRAGVGRIRAGTVVVRRIIIARSGGDVFLHALLEGLVTTIRILATRGVGLGVLFGGGHLNAEFVDGLLGALVTLPRVLFEELGKRSVRVHAASDRRNFEFYRLVSRLLEEFARPLLGGRREVLPRFAHFVFGFVC